MFKVLKLIKFGLQLPGLVRNQDNFDIIIWFYLFAVFWLKTVLLFLLQKLKGQKQSKNLLM